MDRALPFVAAKDHAIELAVVDIGLARAFWEGVPCARLLARIRLDRDERDLVGLAERASGLELASSTWDKLTARLLSGAPTSLDRVKRAVARHGRAASDEGPLVATDGVITALVHALLSATDTDADSSPAEGAADAAPLEESFMLAAGWLDDRLGRTTADRRAAAFEACLHVATLGTVGPTTVGALQALDDAAVSLSPIYPWGESDVPEVDRRAVLLDRTVVSASHALRTELLPLAVHHGSLVAFLLLEPRGSMHGQSVPPGSWLPADFASPDGAARLAEALERGATTAPRARSVILRGGDAALDAIGAEMLRVEAHPFASAVFAEILGRASRERDVVRLVSYLAITPDIATAVHALAASTAREVPNVLRAWLESIAPGDGSRAALCAAALAPYPHLHSALRPGRTTGSLPPPKP